MSDTRQNHDDMLFQMLKECKTLPYFFDEVFGFLQRRTDFYHIATEPNAVVGLPEGLAEKIVRHTFYKWKPQTTDTLYTATDIPTCGEETVMTEIMTEIITECEELNEVTSTTEDLSLKQDETDDSDDFTFANSEYYNGAVYGSYCWSQTILEVHVVVRVSENVNKKDLVVKILPSKLSVKLKDDTVLLEGNLCHKCKANEGIWSLDGRKLEIHLDKCQDMWWNCLIKSEPELDISKIDCTRPYEDLSEEAQAKIQELQWNQERKRLGLPTSEEIVLQEKLKKSWDAEGSPFTGPYDPDAVIF